MDLVDAIRTIQYDSGWAVYAQTPFSEASEARFGQTQFENGGLLDGKEFFANGLEIGDWMKNYFEDCPEMLDDEIEVGLGAAMLIEEKEQWR